jgi:Zn-dependent M28 family amino/carboxypeptidase
MKLIARAAVTLLALSNAACQAPVVEPELDLVAAAQEVQMSIDEASLRAPIAELASDAYEGRGPSSAGDLKAQAYLAAQMEALGLEPGAADGGWLQPFEIIGVTAEAPASWQFLGPRSGLNLEFYDEAIPFSGTQNETAELETAELVFVGYGIQAPEYEWDDYKDKDMTGKVLVMLNNDPDWDPDLFEGEKRLWYGRWDYKYDIAARVGAAGAIIIHTTPSAGYPFQVVQLGWTGEQFELPTEGEPRVEVKGWVTEDAARKLVALNGLDLDELVESAHSRDFVPVPLNVTTSISLTNSVRSAETANVLGVLPGRDPELARELVVFGAHHDHFGVADPNEAGDDIYNGALDNASGCGQALAIAKAFTELPEAPRRSIMFAFLAGEEQGLLGSEYLARHPTVEPGLITANINIDGANIWGETKDVTYIGYGKSSLDGAVEKYAAEQGREVRPDQHSDKGYFYRSDQFNFAKIGVPAVYLDSGTEYVDRPEGWGREQQDSYTEINYHQPTDELTDEWDFGGMIQDARLYFLVAVDVAEADEAPTWNPGDEFEAARLEALKALEPAAEAETSEP